MTDVTEIGVSGFDPTDAAVMRDPYPHYHWLLRNDPVHRGAMGLWFVSRYADVRLVLGDSRFRREGVRDFWSILAGPGPLTEIIRDTVLFQDEPDHGRLRSLIGPAFTPRALRRLRPDAERVMSGLLADVAPRGQMDVVKDIAYPLALSVISLVIGLPSEDLHLIRGWSRAVGPTLDLAASPEEIAAGQLAIGEFAGYVGELIARRGGEPGEDALGLMVAAHRRDGDAAISVNEIISMVFTLIFAGHETVTNQIGNGLLALLRYPGQLDLLRTRPDLIPGAVQECLRYDSSVQSNSRQLGEDLELGGQTLRQGEFAVILLGAANRDPAQFDDPDRFDVTRVDVHPMSFGAGLRFCMGAILARVELEAALRGLVRLAEPRLAVPEADLVYQRSTMFRGLETFPLSFTPALFESGARHG